MKRILPRRKALVQHGFTLIELMVSIAIVAILATIGLTLFNNTQSTARDSKRKGDIDSISSALEAHFNGTGSAQVCPDAPTGSTYGPNNYCAPIGDWFAQKNIPVDPINSSSKGYIYTDNGTQMDITNHKYPSDGDTTFTLCAKLENPVGNASDNLGTTQSNGTFYCRSNQQQ